MIRAGRLDELDLDHIADELDDVGSEIYRRLESALTVLFMHMLKWDYQPEFRSRSWEAAIREQRKRVSKLLEKNSSLKSKLAEATAEGYEYGRDRILMGAHYAMDVIGGRTLATYDLAHLLANDPIYVNRSSNGAPLIKDYQAAVKAARADLATVLQAACGNTIEVCAREDTGRFSDPAANEAFHAVTQTYGLPVVYLQGTEDVGKLAPEAGYLLTVAFPKLTLEQANEILTETEGPGGGFLDNGSSFGVYSRLNLYAAAGRATQMVHSK